jgi:hypothetical protein
MRLDSSGNVGIGTTSPDKHLQISDTTGATIRLESLATSIAANDVIGAIEWEGNDATTGSSGVVGKIDYIAEDATPEYSMRFFTHDNLGGVADFAERMRIDSSGNLLVGTTTANGKISVVGDQLSVATGNGAGQMGIQIKGTTLNAIPAAQVQGYIATGNSTMGVAGDLLIAPRTSVAANIRFITGTTPTERMRIDSSGNLLVGTTSIGASTVGVEARPSGVLVATCDAANAVLLRRNTSDGSIVNFQRDGTSVGSISVTTSATAYNTSSDYRLKDIDGPIANSGAYIDALKPVQGSWKADGSRFIGLLAHEVQEVSETQIATGEKDGEEMQAMDYSSPELIANLIAEIQSLRARVAQLEG